MCDVPRWLLEAGETIRKGVLRLPDVIDSRFHLEDRCISGGSGCVYRVSQLDRPDLDLVLKCAKADSENWRFETEIGFLKDHQCDFFPRVYHSGILPDGRPYYVMERLEPLAETGKVLCGDVGEDGKIACIKGLLKAVRALHKLGFVHEDVKPANIMRRPSTGEIVLVDFGTVHKLDEGDDKNPQSAGYSAPEKGHGAGRDIYAIGQVIRDMFPEEVPIKWTLVINKCISRRPEYRYKSAYYLLKDIVNIDALGKREMEQRILEWRMESVRQQKELVLKPPMKISWRQLREDLKEKCHGDDRFKVGQDELLIDFTRLGLKSIEVCDPMVLNAEKLVVIKGPGVLRADIAPLPNGHRVVVLMDQATLIDVSETLPQARGITYCVGEHCYVNLKKITRVVVLPSSSYRLSAAGDAFVRCGGPDCVADIVSHADGVLWSARPATAVSVDELFGLDEYENRRGLTCHIWDCASQDGKIGGSYLQAMGVQLPDVISQLRDAFGTPDMFSSETGGGCFPLGAIVGTVCGSWYTQLSKTGHKPEDVDKIPVFHKNSRLAVDGDMTIAIAAALCGCKGDWRKLPGFAAKAMRIFGRANPFSFGERFRQWIFDDDMGPYGSWGNGAVMRVSPCAWAATSLDETIAFAEAVTNVSHNSKEAIAGVRAVASAIFVARQSASDKDAVLRTAADYYPELNCPNFTIADIRKDFKYDESCQKTVPQAVRAFYESKDFEHAIRLAISLGGDSDTIAAVTGAIAEAYYGVPDDIRKRVLEFIDDTRRRVLRQFMATFNSLV